MEMLEGEEKMDHDQYPEAFSDSEEEKDDYTIRKTDSIIVAATAVADHSNLEVYIYEHEKANLYVHHEIILGSYPLCIEWLPQYQGEKSNLMVVGTFLPEIEIWNLDSENCEPIQVLGDLEASEAYKNHKTLSTKKNKKKKQDQSTMSSNSNEIPQNTHTDAIMSLSVNPF